MGIPFDVLGLNPQKGDTLVLNFCIGDSDSPSKYVKYSWHYNDNTYLNHDAMYEIILSEEGWNHHVLTRASFIDTAQYRIQLFSKVPFGDHIKLLQSERLLVSGSSVLQNDVYIANFIFNAVEVADKAQPLEIVFGNSPIILVNCFDILRQYLQIPAPRSFANEILLFEKQDAQKFPTKGATLFVGSSSIRFLFPDVKIYMLSNTIAISRKHLHKRYRTANELLKQMLVKYSNLEYVDVPPPD